MVRIVGFVPSFMIALDSDRSSADSTAATTAGESWLPHGVRSPYEWLNHCPKSMTPDFSTRRPVVVVDPVARERARADDLVARAAVGVDRQGQGRPRDRRPELDERLVWHRSRRREAHAPADRLDEAGRRWAHLGFGLDIRQLDRGKAHGGRSDLDRRRADVALTEMAGVHDAPVLDVDERAQLVRLAEAVARPELPRDRSIRSGGGSS